ncbi:complex I subunit 4 family protein [Desulfoglaeba alkanexedens]|uniref:NADH-quinone oxidoreductase subunit M n=1 Tax=Desulfoglaeba alkanexedens ALDC TaxID=980445 RepID=A0A4P8L388_9BACT|nr:NADH-quinone oxidoreductase subunit M [Desulfoglaeba alkanexedens]QCQ21445.1 NADH-quinone oxidoreductase subunit M [Desulfoglaeba alkanexedens ALDC]
MTPMEPAQFPILSTILLSTLLALLVILFIPEHRTRLIKQVSLGFSAVGLMLCIALYFAYDTEKGGLQFVERVLWVKSLGIYYFNAVDGINLPMLVLTSVVLFTGVLTMWELEKRVKEYFALTFLLVAGVYGVFMSMDLFFIFVWYDVSLFPMYPLIAIWGGTRKEYGAMKLTLYLLAGSALILPGILYLWVLGGAGTFDLFELQRIGFTVEAQRIAFVLLYLGFGILAGVWPFHTWSPVGHVAAPTAVSMIHAGVLMKLGAYGILRVGMTLCPEGLVYWADLMALLATIGIVYGAFVGLAQTDLKYVIGYSSVSHMGIVGLGLATMTVDGINGAVFQMFSHGIMTALLFSAVGYIYDRTHTKMIPELGGLSKTMPVASAFFIIAAFCGIGVPCLASFWAELLVFISAVKTYPVRGVFAVMGLVVSALFMLRVVQKTFYGEKNERWEHIPDVPLFLASPRIILVGILVFFGLFPRLILDVIQSAVVPFVNSL